MAIFCLLFIVIGGVSASDVTDMSINPDNNNLVSDSIDQISEESNGNYYTNQLSNDGVSSSDSENLESSDLISEDNSKIKSGALSSSSLSASTDSSTKNTATKKNATTLSISNKTVYSGTTLIITLKDKNGKLLKGKNVVFNITGFSKLYTKTTDSNGQAKLTVSPVGSHKAVFSFDGDDDYNASKLETTINILKSGTSLKVLNNTIPITTKLVVTLKNKNSGNVLDNKKVTFKFPKWHNKVYTVTTDSNGQAKLTIRTNQTLKVIIGYGGSSNLNKTSVTTTIIPIKCDTKFVHYVNLQYGKKFVVALRKASTNEGISGKKVVVKFTNLNKTYTKKTNSNGKVSIPVDYFGTINVKVSFSGDTVFKSSSKKGKCAVIKGSTSIIAPDEVGKGYPYVITLKNSAGTALSKKKLVIKLANKTYTRYTNSNGQVSFNLNLKKGTYSIQITYAGEKTYNSSKVSKTFKFTDPSVSISKIISTAKELKTRVEYINLLNKSYSVTIDNRKFTIDEFAYLMAGAITNIENGSKANVLIKDLSNDYKSSGAKINGNLPKKEYLKLANSLIKYVDSNKRIPNYESTSLGKVEADLYVYAFTCILDSYSSNNKLPSSVRVNTNNVRGGYSYSLSQGGKILNCREIFDADSFAKYLKTGGKSALNDAIKNKAKALTDGLSSPLAKAIAIFRFVRDDVTYSFYTNSLKGAAKTFSTRSGNCCDKANLIVAMCRSVGVYARYSHAQGCKFQSGLYTGHVWAQVYNPSTQTWYSADATSYRNEVGTIKNWNTGSYYKAKTYTLIPF